MTTTPVAERSKPQKEHIPALQLIRSLMGGTAVMREQGQKYLPKDREEESSDYGVRLSMSFLFPAYKKTVFDLADKVFAKELVLGDDVAVEIRGETNSSGEVTTVGWQEDIDMLGRNLNNFAHDLLVDGLQAGINYVYVDMPKPKENATLADEQAPGFRPFLTHLRYEHVLGWKTGRRGDVLVLTQIRFMEVVTEPDPENEFQDLEIEQIRVIDRDELDNISWRVFRKKTGQNMAAEYVLFEEGIFPDMISAIPVVPIYYRHTGYFTGKPPLNDLASLNVQHWQSASDQSNILHVARVPFLFGSGFPADESGNLTVAVTRYTTVSDPASTLQWVEHKGTAIEAGDRDLQNIEQRMAMLGLQMLMPKNNGRTATADMLDAVKQLTALGMIADSLKDGLEEVLGVMMTFVGQDESAGGTITLNKDFGVNLSTADMATIIQMANAGMITKETALREAQRRQVISTDIDAEAELEAVDEERENEDPLGLMGSGDNDDNPDDDEGSRGTDLSAMMAGIQRIMGRRGAGAN